MRWLGPSSFRIQAAIIGAAALAMMGLAVFIVAEVISTTESKLLEEVRQQCRSACRELRFQYDERSTYIEDQISPLPPEAVDLSFRGLAVTVLRAYEGTEGGMYSPGLDRILGYASSADPEGKNPVPDHSKASLIRALVSQINENGGMVTHTEWLDRDLLVASAERAATDDSIVWTLKRIPVIRDPLIAARRWWLGALVFLAVLGMIGIVSIWYMLHSGIARIHGGLSRLESDFTYRLPSIRGDLGQVAEAINRMAEKRMMLEADLRQKDRLAALGKVVSGVAHEVRNPLNSIKLTLELISRRLKKGLKVNHEIRETTQEIDRLNSMVERLLLFGRPAMADRRIQEVAPLLRQAMRMAQEPAQRKSVILELDVPNETLKAEVDGPQIVQVLINLLLNSIEASASGQRVKIEAVHHHGKVKIAVTDEGTAISKEIKPHIFDAYFTTKPEGIGLGLSVSHEIVAGHGGTLELESADSVKTFLILLPAEKESDGENQSTRPHR